MGKASNNAGAPFDFQKLLERSRRQRRIVRVPLWDIEVEIMEMNAQESLEAREVAGDLPGTARTIAYSKELILRGVIGPRPFTPEEVDALMEESDVPIDFLVEEIMKLNKRTEEAAKEAEKSFPVDAPADGEG
jgi:hypothetical protein